MFCRKCGKELSENAAFCPMCGEKVKKAVTESTNTGYTQQPVAARTAPAPSPVAPTPAYDEPKGPSPMQVVRPAASGVAEAVQKAGSNITVLLAGIFGLLSVLVQIFNLIINASRSYGGMSYASGSYFATSILGILFSGLFMILVSVGLILIFASSKSRSGKVGGYTMVKVVCVFKIVFMAILLGVIVIALIVGLVFAGSNMPEFMGVDAFDMLELAGLDDEAMAVGVVVIIVLAIMIAAFVMYFMWYSKMIKTMNLAKTALSGRITAGANASMFVIVFKFIGLFFEVFGVIGGLIGLLSGSSGSFFRLALPIELSQSLSMLGIGSSTGFFQPLFVFLFGLFYVISLIKARGPIGTALRNG